MAEQNAMTRPDAEPGLHQELLEVMRGPAMEIIVAAIMDEVRRRIGGRAIYVHRHDPAIYTQEKAARNDAIRAAFNGTNRREVCKQFNISKTHLYRITSKRSKG